MFRRHWRRGPWGPGIGYGRGPFFPPRRIGYPLLGGRNNTLIDSLLAGGLGYLVGSQMQKSAQQPPQQYQQPPAQPYQPPVQQGTPADNRLSQLKQLGQLRASGVLTDEEFEQEKQKILNGY
ncbi:MAG TPA: SHOCT domain-containing protein [Ktedonobacteraceae bacterium]|nr:SHOCT domain-containing protein [Ktedonobacteraceae bacterium]